MDETEISELYNFNYNCVYNNIRTYGGIIPEITPIESPIVYELGKKLSGF